MIAWSKFGMRAKLAASLAVIALVVFVAACGSSSKETSTNGSSAPRPQTETAGFNGKTINVSGLGDKAYFGDSAIGAQARFKRANDTDELKGVKIQFGEFGDANFDPTTAIAAVRKVVDQQGAFAVVPMIASAGTSGYLNQKKVPFFGWGTSTEYCGTGDKLYGFGFTGCVLPSDPAEVPDFSGGTVSKFLTQSLHIDNPTIAGIGTDNAGGTRSMKSFIAQATGSGLKVVWAKHNLPGPPAVIGDYSPYVQQMLKSNGGKGPDAVWIAGGVADAVNMPKALRNGGYKGIIISAYYSDALLKPLADTYVVNQWAAFESHSAGIDQLVADVKAFQPDAKPTITMAAGYFAADFFVKAVQKAGTKNLTRDSLQQAAAHMTYQITGTVGPTEYPKAFQALNSYCASMLYDDGQTFKVVEPFGCTDHLTKVKGNVSEVG